MCYVCLSTAPCATRLTYNLLRPPQDLIEGDLQNELNHEKTIYYWWIGWWVRGPCSSVLLDTALARMEVAFKVPKEASEAAEKYKAPPPEPTVLTPALLFVCLSALASCPVLSACLLTWRKHTCHLHSSVLPTF
jgi:hypothetical protein